MNKYQKYITYIEQMQTEKTVDIQTRNTRVLIVDGL